MQAFICRLLGCKSSADALEEIYEDELLRIQARAVLKTKRALKTIELAEFLRNRCHMDEVLSTECAIRIVDNGFGMETMYFMGPENIPKLLASTLGPLMHDLIVRGMEKEQEETMVAEMAEMVKKE